MTKLQHITSSYQALTKQFQFISIKTMAKKEDHHLQTSKILLASKKNFPLVQLVDTIRIQKSDIDRGRTDARNFLAVVVGIENSDFLKLANKNGTLKQLYTLNHFVICKVMLNSLDMIFSQDILLREAATTNSRNGEQLYMHCNIKKIVLHY